MKYFEWFIDSSGGKIKYPQILDPIGLEILILYTHVVSKKGHTSPALVWTLGQN